MERNSFVFYKDWKKAIGDLPDDIRLEIYESVIVYATTGNIQGLRPMAKVAFNFIKTDIDRDIEKYISITKRNQDNGNNGGRPRKETDKNPENPVGYLETQTNPNNLDNDNDNDNEKENDKLKTTVPLKGDGGLENDSGKLKEGFTPARNEFENFIVSFNEIRGSKFQAIEKVKRQFNGRLKEGFTPAQMLEALKNAMKDKFHVDNAYKYLTPEFFTRSDKIDKYLNVNENVPDLLKVKQQNLFNKLINQDGN